MSDSTRSTSWIKKSNFDINPELNENGTYDLSPEEARAKEDACHHHALLLFENNIQDFSQWFPGEDNEVSDSLSHDDNIDDETLTILLRQLYPKQVPGHFKI